MLGDALCLLSAAFYACYTVAIKRMLGSDEDTNTMLFFGYVGLINLVVLAPFVPLLQLASVIDITKLTIGMLGLVVAKGRTKPIICLCKPESMCCLNIQSSLTHVVSNALPHSAMQGRACLSAGLFLVVAKAAFAL